MIEIYNKSKCCGCHACFNKCPKNAIEMIEDEQGFKYPKINKEKCINCGLCEKVCPIININQKQNQPIAYACYNLNETIREESSSGGIFSLLSEWILDKNGVVFGAAFNDEFLVQHTYIENMSDLKKFRGSKYLQSLINDTYKKAKEFLDNGRYVLFTGTPCQIEGLMSYLGKKYEKLYTQDIICHSNPSPKVWKKYLEYLEKQSNSKLENVNFRDKSLEGWSNYHLKAKFKTGSEYNSIHSKDKYMKIFLNSLSSRESCYECHFRKLNRVSDITLADFWGIDNILPKMNDEKGTSLVIINSYKGKELFDAIQKDIKCENVDINAALKYNPAMINSPQKNKNREKFFCNLDTMEFDELVKKYVPRTNILQKVKNKCKKILKRVLVKK